MCELYLARMVRSLANVLRRWRALGTICACAGRCKSWPRRGGPVNFWARTILGVTRPRDGADWRGFHHVAVVTRDLEETARFYGEVLGMEVGDPIERDAQGGPAPLHPAWRRSELGSPLLRVTRGQGAPIGPQHRPRRPDGNGRGPAHIAFALPDEAAGIGLRERLNRSGVESTEIGSAGPIRNTLFFDNNGLLLEATWPQPRQRGGGSAGAQ